MSYKKLLISFISILLFAMSLYSAIPSSTAGNCTLEQGILSISGVKSGSTVKVELFDLAGKVVYQSSHINMKGTARIPVPMKNSHSVNNTLVMRLTVNNQIYTSRVVMGSGKIVLNSGISTIENLGAVKTAALPTYNVRLHIIVTANASGCGTGTETQPFSGSFTKESISSKVAGLKTIFSKANINILYNEKTDLTWIKNCQLNQDVPFNSSGVMITPAPSVTDTKNNPNAKLIDEFAKNISGSVVLYMRDFEESWYEFVNSNGQIDRNIAWNYSGSGMSWVRLAKNQSATKIAHEMGHYFHLAHTFGDSTPKDTVDAARMIKNAVAQGRVTKDNALRIFDGDYSGIGDTPADPRSGFMKWLNGGTNSCGSRDSVRFKVKFADNTTRMYTLRPDRLNLMSYFGCFTTSTARYSADQITKILNTITTGNRNHLIAAPAVKRVTAVYKPDTVPEIQVFGWDYKFYRMKYNQIWKEGWRLHALENTVVNGVVKYTATWRMSTAAEYQIYNASYDTYRAWYDKKWEQGYRLHLLSNYVVNGVMKYTAVVRKSTSAEYQIYNATYSQYRTWYDEKWKQGYRLKFLNTSVVNGVVKYVAVVGPSKAAEYQIYNASYDTYRAWYDTKWSQGYRLYILNNYNNSGLKYTAVVRKSTEKEKQYYNWNHNNFRVEHDKMTESRWALKQINWY